MDDKNRQHRRIKKPLTIKFCLTDAYPRKWDQSIVQNISAGGVMFTAPTDLHLKDKIIQVQIRIPELAPVLLELEAMVLDTKPRVNIKQSDVRAKFINLSDTNKEHLSVVEKMVVLQEIKDPPKIT